MRTAAVTAGILAIFSAALVAQQPADQDSGLKFKRIQRDRLCRYLSPRHTPRSKDR